MDPGTVPSVLGSGFKGYNVRLNLEAFLYVPSQTAMDPWGSIFRFVNYFTLW